MTHDGACGNLGRGIQLGDLLWHEPAPWRTRPRLPSAHPSPDRGGSLMPRYATGAPKGRRHRPLQRTLPEGWRPPSPPRTLDATGRKWWRTIWRGGSSWLDESIDCLLIESVCDAVDQVHAIEQHLKHVGRWYETKQGVIAAHPGVADIRQLQVFITSRMSLLGFSPSDRARLNLTLQPGGDDDALARFRARKHSTMHSDTPVQ